MECSKWISSKIAEGKATNQSVKDFAHQMIADHGAANAKLATIVSEQKLTLPKELDAKHKSDLDTLQNSKDPVDGPYVQMQRDAHSDAVALFESYAKDGDNAELKTFAQQTVPTLKMHQEMIEKIASSTATALPPPRRRHLRRPQQKQHPSPAPTASPRIRLKAASRMQASPTCPISSWTIKAFGVARQARVARVCPSPLTTKATSLPARTRNPGDRKMRTVTGLFDTYEDAYEAVGELEATGVPHSDISIVANNSDDWYGKDSSKTADDAAAGAGLGALVGGTGGLLAGLGLMAIPGVGPVVAAGWLVATAVGAAGGAAVGGAAGGIVGALTESGVAENDAHVYAEGVRRGGTLVTARVEDDLVADAQRILGQGKSINIEQRRSDYEAQGWSQFNDEADDFSSAEIEEERARRARRI